jgi:uncharacterized membrane protein YedE/YeeE
VDSIFIKSSHSTGENHENQEICAGDCRRLCKSGGAALVERHVPDAMEKASCASSCFYTGKWTTMNLTFTLFPLGWQHYLLGGLLIGAGVGVLFVFNGLVGGMSTVFSSTWSYVVQKPFFQQVRFTDTRGWRLVFALGLVLGAALWWLLLGDGTRLTTVVPVWQLLVGGFLVGYGARLGNGCTSGHGICGLGSLQWPSLLAVLIFMATAFLTANLVLRFLP